MTLTSKHSFNPSYIGVRKDLLRYISGSGLHILDVGCATGVNGNYLLDQKIATAVDGVEYDQAMAAFAKERYRNVYIGNLNLSDFLEQVENEVELYDIIICGDVLEHLMQPDKVVSVLQKMLKPDGKMIISLPNISHWELLIQIYYKGRFPRNERGIFDKTHLSWFTKSDAINLFTSQGMELVSYKPKFRYRDDPSVTSRWRFAFLRRFFKNLVTFQHIIIVQSV